MSLLESNEKKHALGGLEKTVKSCIACKLATTRNKTVFGEGNADAKIMFVGEGPGKREDELGRPFVGRSGELLTRIIENGLKISRDEVYIANIVKCRPTVDLLLKKDRPPDEEEVQTCLPYLGKQIEIISPKVIITLGGAATKIFLQTKIGITKLRGNWGAFGNTPVMPTYHPSYVLRNGGDKSPLKKDVWMDIKKVIHFLETGSQL